MAPPYRWTDAFVDAGWPNLLTLSAQRLLRQIERRIDGHLQTHISLTRLQADAQLGRTAFFDAYKELTDAGLIMRAPVQVGKRTRQTIALIFPIPAVTVAPRYRARRLPAHFAETRPSLSGGLTSPCQTDQRVPVRRTKPSLSGGLAISDSPRQERSEPHSPSVVQKAVRKVVRKTRGVDSMRQEVVVAATASDDLPAAFREAFAEAVCLIRGLSSTAHPGALNDAALTLSRRMQSQGILWCRDKTAAVLAQRLRA